jgi:hypothetical protein
MDIIEVTIVILNGFAYKKQKLKGMSPFVANSVVVLLAQAIWPPKWYVILNLEYKSHSLILLKDFFLE